MGQIDLFNAELQYLILERFKVVLQYKAYNADNIPCPFSLWSGECSPDWVKGIG